MIAFFNNIGKVSATFCEFKPIMVQLFIIERIYQAMFEQNNKKQRKCFMNRPRVKKWLLLDFFYISELNHDWCITKMEYHRWQAQTSGFIQAIAHSGVAQAISVIWVCFQVVCFTFWFIGR